MKWRYIVLLFVLLCTGCRGNTSVSEEASFDIVTSFYPVYIFTRNITEGIPDVNVYNITENQAGCIHDYQLSTANMKQIENSDVFIINGAGLEGFMDKILEKEEIDVLDSGEHIELLENRFYDGYNEHIWLSISNAILQVEAIGNGLIARDPAHEQQYRENMQAYIDKLKALRNDLRQELYGYENIEIVTSHDAFSYFAKDFGIEIFDVIERGEDVSPTPKEMSELIAGLKESSVVGIFAEQDASDKLSKMVSDETGIKVYTLDSITSGEADLESYEKKMQENIKRIKESVKSYYEVDA
ncbi:MAG: zinc ABC transporter substrate-binding protein [Clostridia bacterium]|nr:zinc ABC transporter substrate-binding protein [Clostridia bacterium]